MKICLLASTDLFEVLNKLIIKCFKTKNLDVEILKLENQNMFCEMNIIACQKSQVKEILKKVKNINVFDYPLSKLTLLNKPEGFLLFIRKNSGKIFTLVIGYDRNGTLYGMGRFLRLIQFKKDHIDVEETVIIDNPAFKIRGHALASHWQNNTTENWNVEDWESYIQDLVLFGMNTLVVYPVHFARWPNINPWSKNDISTDKLIPHDQFTIWKRWGVPYDPYELMEIWEKRWEIHKQIPLIAHSYGIRYGIWIPPNDIFPAQVEDYMGEGNPYIKSYVCPSIPEARELILRNREYIFRELPHIDFLFIPSGDEGGCSKCGDEGPCAPWVRTYLELVEDTYKILSKYHPSAKIWISNQKLPYSQQKILFEYLDKKRPTWIECVAFGPSSDPTQSYLNENPEDIFSYEEFGSLTRFLKEMRTKIPGDYEIVLYPDITHPVRSQYAIRNMDSRLYFLCGREDAPNFRPVMLSKIYRETARYSSGSIPYSEGNHDDFNKILWTELDWYPLKDIKEIIKDYCNCWFNFRVPNCYEIISLIEKIYGQSLSDQLETIDDLFSKIERVKNDSLLSNNWRWLLIVFTVYMLKFLQMKIIDEKNMKKTVEKKLSNILKKGQIMEGLKDIVRFYEQNKSNYEVFKDVLKRLAQRIYKLAGIELKAVNRLDMCITDLDWIMNELKKSLQLEDVDQVRSRIKEILDYENPGPGGFYDNAGEPGQQPHLVQREWVSRHVNLHNVTSDMKPSQYVHLFAPGKKGITFKYTSLDPNAQYRVKVTYLADDWGIGGVQQLFANNYLIHDYIEMPWGEVKQFTFDIPRSLYENGSLELKFISEKSKYVVISEIWLLKTQ